MTGSSNTLYLVEHQVREAATVEVVGALLGLEPRRFLTAEGALEAVEGGPPDFLVTDLLLPGEGGLDLIRGIKARAPDACCILLSAVPPGLSSSAAARYGLDAVVVKRGEWTSELRRHVEARMNGAAAPIDRETAALLHAIEQGDAGFDALAAWLVQDQLTPAREVMALRYLAAAFDPDRVLSVLERVVLEDSSCARPAGGPDQVVHEDLHRTALELAMDLGGAGFEIVEQIAASMATAPPIRGRAMRHLARFFPHDVVMPVLDANLRDPDPLVRLDAAHAALQSATRVGVAGFGTLSELAEAAAIPDEVRIAALEHLAHELPKEEIRPILARALESDRTAIVHAASALTMQGDGVDLQTLTAEAKESASIEGRIRALHTLAAGFPTRSVLPILEDFQGDEVEEVRRCAFELAMSRANVGFEDTLERAIWHGPFTQHAALLGAQKLGQAGFTAVAAIAERTTAAPEIRAMAARMLGVRFGSGLGAPVLTRLVVDRDFEVASAALMAAVQMGTPGFAVLKSAQTDAPIPAVRELALRHLDEHAPDPVFNPALGRALRDPDVNVRCAAVEIAMRRAGADYRRFLDRLAGTGHVDLQQAGLDGAIALGEAGFSAIAAFALEAKLERAVRVRALFSLMAEFPPEDVAPILAHVKKTRPEDLVAAEKGPVLTEAPPPVPSRDTDTVPGAPADVVETERVERATGYDQELTRFDLPSVQSRPKPKPKRAPRAEVEPKPDRAVEPTPAPKPEPEAKAEAQTPPRPAVPPSDAPTEVDAKPWEVAVTKPVPPADDPSPPTRVDAGPSRPASLPKVARDQIDLGRARAAFQAALRAGRDGYRAIRMLADSRRVPEEVRIQALRHLAADFPDQEVRPVLEKAMADDSRQVQNVGLGCSMLRQDTRLEPVLDLVNSEKSESGLRARAIRFMSARFDKKQVKPILEALLEEPDPKVVRAALESIFTSIKYVHPDRVEEHLCNLLTEHASEEVKTSAAKALGALGGKQALGALDKFTGWFADGDVKDAAKAAAARIRQRLTGR